MAPAETTGTTEPEDTTPTTEAAKPQADSSKDSSGGSGVERSKSEDGVPVWAVVLIGVFAAAAGVGVAVILTRKKA